MAAAAAGERLLTLGVGGLRYAVPSRSVREVAYLPRLARVPLAPPALLGLANIRGTIVPVLSLAMLVDRHAGSERRVLIIDDAECVGLAVDTVLDLVDAGDVADDSSQILDIKALLAHVSASGERRARRGTGLDGTHAVEAVADTVPLVILALGNQEFAFPLGVVEQILRMPSMIAHVPHADPAVVGSAAVGGMLLPLLSLRGLLALPGSDDMARARVLVVRIGGHRVGLVIDAVRSIARVPEDWIDAVPQILARGSAEARIQAICRLDDGKRLVSVLSTDDLVREDVASRLVRAAGDQQVMDKASAGEAVEQFVVFRIGDAEFGLPIDTVEQVVRLPPRLTRLPKAPSFVRGVMNLRGRTIAVIDQAERFGAKPARGQKCRVLVVRIGDLYAGFVVDSTSEILRVAQGAVRAAPDLGNAETRIFERVASVGAEQRIVLIVSARELLDRAEQDMLRNIAADGPIERP